MNALYVTVSVSLLLLLAGFNHAHGLTTFGKSGSSSQQNTHPPMADAKSCTRHDNCKGQSGTSCVIEPGTRDHYERKVCLCGNNHVPNNGICPPVRKLQFHMCNTKEDCEMPDEMNCVMNATEQVRVCLCDNGDIGARCGSPEGNIMSALTLILSAIAAKWIY